jgi:hypothetical protein
VKVLSLVHQFFQNLSTIILPTCNEEPTKNNQLTNKSFIDKEIKVVNARILELEKKLQEMQK